MSSQANTLYSSAVEIRILRRLPRALPPTAARRLILERGTEWNDGGSGDDPGYVTLFDVHYQDRQQERPLLLGSTKILRRGARRLDGPEVLDGLPDDCCSLGQTIDFYRAIEALDAEARADVLASLRDVTSDAVRAQAFAGVPGFRESLLRFSEAALLFSHGPHALLHAPPQGAPLEIRFRASLAGFEAPHELALEFSPSPRAVGRLAAVAGPNGTGKTQLLARLAWALWGVVRRGDSLSLPERRVGRVIAISYSALDVFDRPPHRLRKTAAHPAFDNYCYCGFRDEQDRLDPAILFKAFGRDLAELTSWGRRTLWRQMLEDTMLLSVEPDLAAVARDDDAGYVAAATRLGAGEKTALSVLTRVLAKIRNRAFVLFDEPELNMHPALLTRMLRVLNGWLEEFDCYGVVATHSPFVLQEIPGRQIAVLGREGRVPYRRAYEGESFGATLSEIVSEVFGVEEEDRNYAGTLKRLVEAGATEAQIEESLGRPLSLNARMAIRHFATRRDVVA